MTPRFFLLPIALALLVPVPALAYVDPGSGYLIWQLIVSIGVGAMLGFMKFWQAVGRLFVKSPTVSSPPEKKKKKAA